MQRSILKLVLFFNERVNELVYLCLILPLRSKSHHEPVKSGSQGRISFPHCITLCEVVNSFFHLSTKDNLKTSTLSQTSHGEEDIVMISSKVVS